MKTIKRLIAIKKGKTYLTFLVDNQKNVTHYGTFISLKHLLLNHEKIEIF